MGPTQDEILPLDIDYIPVSVSEKADEELHVPEEERNGRLLELIKLLAGHKLSKSIIFNHDFLQRYLIHSRYDVNRAFSRVRSFLTLRKNHNYFFQNIKFDFTVNPASQFITVLPYRTSDGCIILLYEIGKWNPHEVSLEVVKQLTFMIYMQELRNPVTQLAGVHAIFDFADVGVKHLRYFTPYNMYLLNHVSFEVVPVIYRGYHLINGNSVMNTILNWIKPFTPGFFRKILFVYSSPEKLLDLFPPSLLPSKYGGNLTEYYMADRLKNINEQHDNYAAGGQKNTF